MSRIEVVKPNYQPNYQKNSNLETKKTKFAQQPSFNGGSPVVDEVRAYGKTIDSKLGFVGWLSKKLNKNDGEVQTQLGNALFTSTLAPFVIAFNPVSKEDSDTKKYTALRQPISAVIAVGSGLLVTMPFNNFMEKIASEGYIEPIDLRMNPNEKYLKRLYKKERKQAKKNGTLEKFKTDNTPNKMEGEFNVDAYVKSKQEKAEALFKRLLYEDPESIKNNPDFKEIANIDKFVEQNNLHKVDFKIFMNDNFKVKLFDNGDLKEEAFEKQLNEIKAMDFLRKTGLIKSEFDSKTGKYAEGSFTEEELKAFLASKRQEKVASGFAKHGYTIDAAKEMAEEIGKETARQIQRSVKSNKETVMLNEMLETLQIKKDFIKNVETKNVAKVLTEFAEVHMKELSSLNGKKIEHFAGQLLTNQIKKTTADFKNYNKYVGIFINLFTIAVSCTVLNWAYPRIVERLFPNLAKSKAEKGGKK